jgi:N-acetyl-alpha-D-muramate 1-phosphate uridylyltransferase
MCCLSPCGRSRPAAVSRTCDGLDSPGPDDRLVLISMQAVLLAGGLGTRLGDLAGGLPKPMVDVDGKPFLELQLELLQRHGLRNFVLCIGYRGPTIQDYFGDGRKFGIELRYSLEEKDLLGTAGAVKQAEPLLQDEFFLIYADSYLRMDYQGAYAQFHANDRLGMMVVLRNDDQYDRSNLVIDDGFVTTYDKGSPTPQMHYINFGVSLLRREALALVPAGVPYSQEEWFQDLIRSDNLMAFETFERFYEIGSPSGLMEFRRLLAAGVLP